MHLLDFLTWGSPAAIQRLHAPEAFVDDGDAANTPSTQRPAAATTSNAPPYEQLYVPPSPTTRRWLMPPRSQTTAPAPSNVDREPQQAPPPPPPEPQPSTTPPSQHAAQPSTLEDVTAAADAAADSVAAAAVNAMSSMSPETPSAAPESQAKSQQLGLKGCHSRACAGVMDTFKRALRNPSTPPSPPPSAASTPTQQAADSSPQPEADATAAAAAAPTAAPSAPQADTDAGEAAAPDFGFSSDCPPDTAQIGRATWTFLHSVAAAYPDQPTERQQALMRGLLDGLVEFYPCQICAEHLREQVSGNPPRVATAQDLNLWLCGIHNEVNEMLGKPLFDCSRVLERWRDGPSDGSCG